MRALSLFWAVLAVLGAIAFFLCGGVWDDITAGTMEFLFLMVGGGFTLVAGLDHLYERSKEKNGARQDHG